MKVDGKVFQICVSISFYSFRIQVLLPWYIARSEWVIIAAIGIRLGQIREKIVPPENGTNVDNF